MRTTISLNRSLLSSVVFAAADKATGPATTESPVTAPTDSIEQAISENPAIKPLSDDAQVTALKSALGGQRKVYDSFEAAYEALTKISESDKTKELFGLPVAIVGFDPESGEVDPAVYEGSRAVLAFVGHRGVKKPGAKKDDDVFNSIKAVVIFPVPTLESFLATDEAKAWLGKIIDKEASHVAFRNFRDTNTLNELMNGAKASPKNVQDYITASTRDGDGLDTDTFDALWSAFRTMLRSEQPVIFKLLPGKAEVIKCIRSKAYAESGEETAPLEEKGVFAKIGQMLVAGAEQNKDKDGQPQPLESDTIKDWLAGRDTLVLNRATPAEKDFSALGSLNW